jgi:dienelactone hydrolase
MTVRNLSPQLMFERLAQEHRPECRFRGRTPAQFRRWRAATLPRVLATLGDAPRRVPPNPQLLGEWEHEGLRKQRWILDVGPHIAATVQVNYPPDLARRERRPAILCWHGHGPYGKDPVMGNAFTPEMIAHTRQHNYDYGHQMAQKGFVSFGLDWIGGGERNDSRKPNWRSHNFERDWCDLYYLHATMLGMTSLSINLAHGRAATDFAGTLPHVDPRRLGVMGLSGGGVMALWTALCDRRFKAAEIICYSDLWATFGLRDINYCGMQVAPGLYKLVDLPDLQGLLAPKPLLIDIGANDTCFRIDTAMMCHRHLRGIYRAAGAADRLELDLFAGEHAWGGNKSESFFRKHL